MEHALLQQLQQRPLLCDGAMGTLLYARGVNYEQCFDALNLSQPELILNIHREYISAGAQVIETNSFGANRAKLEAYNLGDRVREINMRAVKLAREAREVSGQSVFVAGAVGPSGRPLQAPDEHRLSELRTIFREQVNALQDGGADLLILETFSNLAELRQAILAAKESGLPIIAQMSFYEDGHTLSGQSAARVAAVLSDLGVDVIGANCSVGPAATFDVLEEMIAEATRHRQTLAPQNLQVIRRDKATTARFLAEEVILPRQGSTTRLQEKLAAGEFVVSVELDPPKGLNPAKILEGAALLQEAGVDCINIADSPMARVRMSCIALARLIQDHLGIETIIHFT